MKKQLLFFIFIFGISGGFLSAQNPLITNQFSADPTARVFGNKIYVYPSHDILAKEGKGKLGWFCMEDYHVFSSKNLTEWTDHGVIVSQDKVPWTNPTAYSMWAPDCVFRNGKYFFYFPALAKDTIYGRGFTIGVAVADKPEGPYIPESKPIIGVHGIDPCVFIDNDGQAYIYYAARNIYVAKLKENMKELASEPQTIANLPEKGLKEGPFIFERNGKYYLTYPHVENKIERLEYAVADNPLGPFKQSGVIMDESPMNCWTNHQSFIEWNGQWYLFYHQNALSPKFDKNRAICADSLFFNADGTIRKVIPTLRGVGATDASVQIQIDRYTEKSENGVGIEFNDTLNTFLGWKTIFSLKNSWVKYNAVNFSKKNYKTAIFRVKAKKDAIFTLKLTGEKKIILEKINIPASENYRIVKVEIAKIKTGMKDVFVSLDNDTFAEIDWISFE